jgi:Tfp pilus assembly protein PilO
MAKSVVGQLAKQPLKIQLAILAGVLAVLGFAYWQFFFSGLQEQRAAAESKKQSTAKKLDELREDKRALDALQRERPERKLKIEKGLLKLPAKSELPAFLKQLQNQAGAAGVKLKSYSQLAELAVDDFVKVPYQIEASGTFYQLTRYFWLLWEYSKSDSGMIITIENLSLGEVTPGSDGIILTANFVAATFRQADAGEDLPPVATEPADGKKPADKPKVDESRQKREDAVEAATGAAGEAAAPAAGAAAAPATNPGAGDVR